MCVNLSYSKRNQDLKQGTELPLKAQGKFCRPAPSHLFTSKECNKEPEGRPRSYSVGSPSNKTATIGDRSSRTLFPSKNEIQSQQGKAEYKPSRPKIPLGGPTGQGHHTARGRGRLSQGRGQGQKQRQGHGHEGQGPEQGQVPCRPNRNPTALPLSSSPSRPLQSYPSRAVSAPLRPLTDSRDIRDSRGAASLGRGRGRGRGKGVDGAPVFAPLTLSQNAVPAGPGPGTVPTPPLGRPRQSPRPPPPPSQPSHTASSHQHPPPPIHQAPPPVPPSFPSPKFQQKKEVEGELRHPSQHTQTHHKDDHDTPFPNSERKEGDQHEEDKVEDEGGTPTLINCDTDAHEGHPKHNGHNTHEAHEAHEAHDREWADDTRDDSVLHQPIRSRGSRAGWRAPILHRGVSTFSGNLTESEKGTSPSSSPSSPSSSPSRNPVLPVHLHHADLKFVRQQLLPPSIPVVELSGHIFTDLPPPLSEYEKEKEKEKVQEKEEEKEKETDRETDQFVRVDSGIPLLTRLLTYTAAIPAPPPMPPPPPPLPKALPKTVLTTTVRGTGNGAHGTPTPQSLKEGLALGRRSLSISVPPNWGMSRESDFDSTS